LYFQPKDEQPSEIFARVLTDLSALGGPILPEAAATGLLHIFDVFRRGKKNVKKITHKRETNLTKNGKKALPPENPTKEAFVVRLAEPEVVDEEDDEATCFPEDGTDDDEMLQFLEGKRFLLNDLFL
jgi:hypothetical protein